MSDDEHILALCDLGVDQLVQERLRPGVKLFYGLGTAYGFLVRCRILEDNVYRAVRYLETVLDAFVITETHLEQPVIFYYGHVPSFEQDLGSLDCSYKRRTVTYIEMGIKILIVSISCHLSTFFVKRDISASLKLVADVPVRSSVSHQIKHEVIIHYDVIIRE